MLSGFLSGILYAVGALKDERAPAAAYATALAAAGTTADGPPILRRCWRMDKAGRISDLKLVVSVGEGGGVYVCVYRSANRSVGRRSTRAESFSQTLPAHPHTQQEEPIGAPAPGHIRVAVKAIGLNLADVFAIIGLYSATPKGKGFGVGRVVA